MKYLIVSTFEMDGHSSAAAMICSDAIHKRKYLQELLSREDGSLYPTHNKVENGDEEIWYGEWECGQWSISITPFKTFTSICNKERFTQTG